MQDPIYAKIESQARPSLFTASGLILLATAGLWLSWLIELALPAGTPVLLINALYYVPFIALPLALCARRRPGLSEALRLNPPPLPAVLALAALGLVSVYVASALAAAWKYGLDALGLRGPVNFPQAHSEGELALSILSMAALPAVCEELLFRGFALSAWESRGTAYAIGVTSALFALLHSNLYGLPVYLLVGAVAGFATFALNSVYAGIIYHTVYNAACLIIPYLLAGQAGAAQTAATEVGMIDILLELITQAGMMAMLLGVLWLWAKRADIAPIPRVRRPLSGQERAMLGAAVGLMLVSLAALSVLMAAEGAQ